MRIKTKRTGGGIEIILGINFKGKDRQKDTYIITQINAISDDMYHLCDIKQFMQEFNTCVIVPNRESFQYNVGDIDTFNNIRFNMTHKFVEYSKGNHTTELFENFIYNAGYMHGIICASIKMEEKLNEIRGM